MVGFDRRAAGKNEVAKCLGEEEEGTGDEEDNVDRHASRGSARDDFFSKSLTSFTKGGRRNGYRIPGMSNFGRKVLSWGI
jgi:hypothetical protein